MTPAEHVAEALRLLRSVVPDQGGPADDDARLGVQNTIAAAQVHATLATVPPSSLTPPAPKPAPIPCDEYATSGERCVRPLFHEGQHDMRMPT